MTAPWHPVDAVSFNGEYYQACDVAVDRVHVWDGTPMRRVGMVIPYEDNEPHCPICGLPGVDGLCAACADTSKTDEWDAWILNGISARQWREKADREWLRQRARQKRALRRRLQQIADNLRNVSERRRAVRFVNRWMRLGAIH